MVVKFSSAKMQILFTIVATSEIVNSNTHGTTPEYVVTNFIYDEENDCYTCPQGNILNTTGSL